MASVTTDITPAACIERELNNIKRTLVSRTHLLQDPDFVQRFTEQLNIALARLDPGNNDIPDEDGGCRHADCVHQLINEIYPNINRLLRDQQISLVDRLLTHVLTSFPPQNGHCAAAYPFN